DLSKRFRMHGPQSDLVDQTLSEAGPPLRPARQDGEVAIRTDGRAERDVEVEAGEQGASLLSADQNRSQVGAAGGTLQLQRCGRRPLGRAGCRETWRFWPF